ncbi:MAG: hypothetical protein ACXU8S_14765 [Phenylobacterium sp.]
MFAEPPPSADVSAISAMQQADLECLSIGYVLANATHSGLPSPTGTRLVRVYLGRLRGSDPSREWLRMIVPESQMSYGWFLGRLQECQRPLRPSQVRSAPTQAAPPAPSPATPTGG